MESVNRLGPELILLAVAGLVLIVDAFSSLMGRGLRPLWERGGAAGLALMGAVGALAWAAALIVTGNRGSAFSDVYRLDDFSLFFAVLFAGVAAAVVLASVEYLRGRPHQAEYYVLVLTTAAGLSLLAGAVDLILIFVALELTALSQYVLVGFLRDQRSSEAGLKYLLIGAVSAALTLYGMAFLFGLSGSTNLVDIARAVSSAGDDARAGYVLAAVLLAAGLGFKMAVVPFQMWVPDVYQGAPTPVAAFLSVGSKAAGFAVAIRLFVEGLGDRFIAQDWGVLFGVLAALSMTIGNLMALPQMDIKRLLGYSSIAQAGYFLIGLAAVSAGEPQPLLGTGAVIFFLAAYAFTNLAAFAAVIAISQRIGSDFIGDYAGMARRSLPLALALTLALVSLTGIPPTAGFVAKLYIFNAAVQADLVWLAVLGVVNSVVSAYYYLRVVLTMFVDEPRRPEPLRPAPAIGLTVLLAVAGLLVVGVFPFPLIDAAEAAARVLG